MKKSFRHLMLASAAIISISLNLSPVFAGNIIPLPGSRFFPEGIAADSRGGFYVGSLTEGRIVYLEPKSHKVKPFVAAGTNGLVTVVGIYVNAKEDLLYVCSSDPGFGNLTGSAKPALLAFRTADGSPAGRFELPEGGFCNDIAELDDGTILATDSFNPRIYAVRPGSNKLSTWLEDDVFKGKGFQLNGITSLSGDVFVVRYATGTLYRIAVNADGYAGKITEITLNRPLKGPDGLKVLNAGTHELLVVEGGGLSAGSRGLLSKVKIQGTNGTVSTIADNLNVPTTASIRNGTAYVVEGQLDHLFDKSAGAPDPFQIVRIPVR